MAEDPHRAKEQHPHPKRTNTWIVALGLLCVAGSIYYGFDEFGRRSREQVEAVNAQTAVMKAQEMQRLYEQKHAAYMTITGATSKIAALKAAGDSPAQMQDAVSAFKALLWGPAAITGGPDFNEALALFNRGLDAGADAGQLQQLSLDVARVCGNEERDLFPAGFPGGAQNHVPVYGMNTNILGSMREILRSPESQLAAGKWLALLDSGNFTESWKSASGFFQTTIPQERWERAIAGIRTPFGGMVSRRLRNAVRRREALARLVAVRFVV